MNSFDLKVLATIARRVEHRYSKANETSALPRSDTAEIAQKLRRQADDELAARARSLLGGHFLAHKKFLGVTGAVEVLRK